MTSAPSRPSRQDGTYPRPQLQRSRWADLCGTRDFAGARAATPAEVDFDRQITVPFPPESPASGVGETGYLGEVWYRRVLSADELSAAGLDDQGDRLVLRFGA